MNLLQIIDPKRLILVQVSGKRFLHVCHEHKGCVL